MANDAYVITSKGMAVLAECFLEIEQEFIDEGNIEDAKRAKILADRFAEMAITLSREETSARSDLLNEQPDDS